MRVRANSEQQDRANPKRRLILLVECSRHFRPDTLSPRTAVNMYPVLTLTVRPGSAPILQSKGGDPQEEPLENGKRVVRDLIVQIVAASNGSVQSEKLTMPWNAPRAHHDAVLLGPPHGENIE